MSGKKKTPVEKFLSKYGFTGTPAGDRMEKDLIKLLEAEYLEGHIAGAESMRDEEEEPVYDDGHGHGLAE